MIKFNLKYIAEKNKLDFNQVRDWLNLLGFFYTFKRTINLPDSKYKSITKELNYLIQNGFTFKSKYEIERFLDKLRKTRTDLNIVLNLKNSQLNSLLKEANPQNLQLALKTHEDAIVMLQNEYKKNNTLKFLTLNSHYQEHISQKKALQQKIKNQESELKRTSIEITNLKTSIDDYNRRLELVEATIANYAKQRDEIVLQEKINKKEKLKERQVGTPSQPKVEESKILEIDWENVFFQNNYVLFKFNNHWLERTPLKNSKQSFNAIKSIYQFRNAPKLIIRSNGRKVERIENIEVLNYYLDILENSGMIFQQGKTIAKVFQHYKHYNKAYFSRHLKEIFLPRCFETLCKIADENLPIIPVPELVKNNSNSEVIHDSFLFPIVSVRKVFWIWESIEESKATYIFSTNRVSFENDVQILYDFLTGETVNKRSRLISGEFRNSGIELHKRLFHTDFDSWRKEVIFFQKNILR